MSFNTITHPVTGVRYSIFSSPGRNLLKNYLNTYKLGGSTHRYIKNTSGNTSSENINRSEFDEVEISYMEYQVLELAKQKYPDLVKSVDIYEDYEPSSLNIEIVGIKSSEIVPFGVLMDGYKNRFNLKKSSVKFNNIINEAKNDKGLLINALKKMKNFDNEMKKLDNKMKREITIQELANEKYPNLVNKVKMHRFLIGESWVPQYITIDNTNTNIREYINNIDLWEISDENFNNIINKTKNNKGPLIDAFNRLKHKIEKKEEAAKAAAKKAAAEAAMKTPVKFQNSSS